MRSQVVPVSCNTEEKAARYAASAQHGVRSQRAKQAKGVHPRFCAETLHRPRNPSDFISRETIDSTGWPISPTENTSRWYKMYSEPRQNNRDEGFSQIRAPDRLQLHRISSGATMRTSRCSNNVCKKGVTSRVRVSVSTSCSFERPRKISLTRRGSASMHQISVATRLKSKYEPASKLRTTARPSTSAAANSWSRT